MNALSALGVAPEKPTFPAVVGCPLCHAATLYLFDDFGTDGIWMHCETCRAHGDIITFGARIWNTSLANALTRFADIGAIVRNEGERAAAEYSRAANRLQAAESFWSEVEGQCWNHGDDIIACRLRELGVERELTGCHGLIGVAHPDQIAKLCAEVGRATPPRTREHGPSLVLPFYDLPGRLTGFLLVQYDEAFQSRRTFVTAMNYKKRQPEAGYYLLHTAFLPAPQTLRDSYFVVDDPFWALKAQTAQIRAGSGLLPIASAYHGSDAVSSGNNWASFPKTPRFFHGPVAGPELISQACAAKGYVCVLPHDKIERTLTPPRTFIRLAAMRKKAQTWQQALVDLFTASSDLTAQAFASRLTIPHDRLQQFFDKHAEQFSAEYAARIMSRITAAPTVPTKVHRRWVVVERDNGWWTHTGQPVCNARVQITNVILANNGTKLYSGVIDTASGQLTFIDAAQKIERMGLLAFAQQHAAAEGVLIRYDRAWNTRAHLISMTLHEPELTTVSGDIGWDSRTSEFCFYGYSLANDGSVVPTPFPGIRTTRQADFPTPDTVAPLSLRSLLTVSTDNTFLWTIFGAIVTDLVAPIVNKQQPVMALTPVAFDAAATIGAALDCAQHKTSARSYSHVMDSIVSTINKTAWPVFISHGLADKYCSPSVPRCTSGAGFVRLPEACCWAAPSYGWHALALQAPAQPIDANPLRYVLPAYIQRILQKRVTLLAGAVNPFLAILEDLAIWLQSTYGGTFNLALTKAKLFAPERAHEAVMAGINQALLAEQLDILPRPRRKDQPKNYLLRQKRHWWLNEQALDRYFYSAGKLVPNWLAIRDLLEANQLLLGDETVNNMNGVLVRRDWCDRFWSDYSAAESRDFG